MDPILVGKAVTTETSSNVYLLPKYGNRHGLVAGATGTGKTVTLMTLAEGFSRIGVPVFLADVKGDVAGLAAAGTMNEKIQQRIAQMGIAARSLASSPAHEIRSAHYLLTRDDLFRHGGSTPVLVAAAQGADVRVIGLSWTVTSQPVLVLPGSPIRTAADLRGARLRFV